MFLSSECLGSIHLHFNAQWNRRTASWWMTLCSAKNGNDLCLFIICGAYHIMYAPLIIYLTYLELDCDTVALGFDSCEHTMHVYHSFYCTCFKGVPLFPTSCIKRLFQMGRGLRIWGCSSWKVSIHTCIAPGRGGGKAGHLSLGAPCPFPQGCIPGGMLWV